MKLYELNIGDRFYPKSKENKATPIFEVKSKEGHFVWCKNLQSNADEFKRKSLEVIKTT